MSGKHWKSFEFTPEMTELYQALLGFATKLEEKTGIKIEEVVVERLPRVYVDRPNEDTVLSILTALGNITVRQSTPVPTQPEQSPDGVLR